MAGLQPECTTLWDYFQRTLRRIPNNKFLGTRQTGTGYEWTTFREAANAIEELTQGMNEFAIGTEQTYPEHPN